jgi:hypothetical protein
LPISERWHETKSNVTLHRESIPEIQEPESSGSEDEGIANNRLSPSDSNHSIKRVTFTMGSVKKLVFVKLLELVVMFYLAVHGTSTTFYSSPFVSKFCLHTSCKRM